MDRLSSSSSSSHYQTSTPLLLQLPDEAIVSILSQIHKADNQTLSALVQSCKDMWRLAGVDALRSFFYAAREAFDTGENKTAIFNALCEWLPMVADQLPQETGLNMIEQLSDLIAQLHPRVNDLSSMSNSVDSLHQLIYKLMRQERQRHPDAEDTALRLLTLAQHVSNQFILCCETTQAELFALQAQIELMMRAAD